MEPSRTTMIDSPCIEVDLGASGLRPMTVVAYDAVQRERYEQPLWARRAPAVEELSAEPSRPGWSVRIVDQDAYNHQMQRLLGLSE